MPSKSTQLTNLGKHLLAWFVWLPLTGSPTHDRTYGELKRLTPRQALVLSVPLWCYAGVGAWLYLYFPGQILPIVAAVYGTGIALGGSLIVVTGVLARLSDRRLARRSNP